MKIIDARGQNCPIPVVMAKKAITEGVENITIYVDNKIAVQNLEKMAQNSGFNFAFTPKDKDFEVVIVKDGAAVIKEEPKIVKNQEVNGEWALFVTDKAIGNAPNELGENLIKMYFYTLSQGESRPSVCIFMNEGVKLLENEEICQSFKELMDKGVKFMFCGACLNFYGISDLCEKDNVSNMYAIVEEMDKYSKVVKL